MYRFGRCALPACAVTLALACMPVQALAADDQVVQEAASTAAVNEAVAEPSDAAAAGTSEKAAEAAGTSASASSSSSEVSDKAAEAKDAAASKSEGAAEDSSAAGAATDQSAGSSGTGTKEDASSKDDAAGTDSTSDDGAGKSQNSSAADAGQSEASKTADDAASSTAADSKQDSAEAGTTADSSTVQDEKASETDAAAAKAAAVSVTDAAKSSEASADSDYDTTGKVPLYRLYNQWTGEHFFTVNTYEATDLINRGWSGESVSWFAPTYSTVKVYRLYNQWSGDHYYTTNRDERKSLIKLGWTNEGVGWFSDTNDTVSVFTLFNPFAKIATHHYTTQASERDQLVKLGWVYQKGSDANGASWYGVTMPGNGWFASPAGDRLLISGGTVQNDKIVYDGGKQRYITTAGFEATRQSSWYSPSAKRYYYISDGGNLQVLPQSGANYCWLKDSPYWSGTVKEVHMNKNYMEGRYYDGVQHVIKKIVIHHNAATLTTEGCWNTWQTRAASAHYQVEADGTVGQLVYDSDTAWQAGNWNINLDSIGIEHADAPGSSDRNGWRLTEATINSGAKLVAILCIEYQLGRPQWGVNVVGHNECSSTSCPASLAKGGSQHNEYISKAQSWYDKLTTMKI